MHPAQARLLSAPLFHQCPADLDDRQLTYTPGNSSAACRWAGTEPRRLHASPPLAQSSRDSALRLLQRAAAVRRGTFRECFERGPLIGGLGAGEPVGKLRLRDSADDGEEGRSALARTGNDAPVSAPGQSAGRPPSGRRVRCRGGIPTRTPAALWRTCRSKPSAGSGRARAATASRWRTAMDGSPRSPRSASWSRASQAREAPAGRGPHRWGMPQPGRGFA